MSSKGSSQRKLMRGFSLLKISGSDELQQLVDAVLRLYTEHYTICVTCQQYTYYCELWGTERYSSGLSRNL